MAQLTSPEPSSPRDRRGRCPERILKNQTLGERLDFADDIFAAVISAGVLTSGHAPPSCFDELIRIIRPGSHLIFTLSTSVYEAGGFRAKLEALSRQRVWRSLEITPTWRALPRATAEAAAMARAHVFQLP